LKSFRDGLWKGGETFLSGFFVSEPANVIDVLFTDLFESFTPILHFSHHLIFFVTFMRYGTVVKIYFAKQGHLSLACKL